MSYTTSIIIVTYNNFHTTTGPCLQSLLPDQNQTQAEFEIIVVDNASGDETSEQLKSIASTRENIRLVLNKINRGFAGGNNDGVNTAHGDIIILLNSDTIVPEGAIEKLSKLLIHNKDWGLLGPVTNQAGNEQKIFTSSSNIMQTMEEGKNWCLHSNNDYFRSPRLDFFCVAMFKTTYQRLGGLDEGFGLGYFEDTDFSIRANKMGLKMVFTEEVFIYHKAGNSFSKMGKRYVRQLMHENRKKLIKKHKNMVKLHHIRERNLDIMKQYLEKKKVNCASCPGLKNSDQGLNNLDYKFQNRLCLAKSLYPNGLIKKICYHYQLKNIDKKYYNLS